MKTLNSNYDFLLGGLTLVKLNTIVLQEFGITMDDTILAMDQFIVDLSKEDYIDDSILLLLSDELNLDDIERIYDTNKHDTILEEKLSSMFIRMNRLCVCDY